MSFKLMGRRHHWFSRQMTSEEHEPSANNQPHCYAYILPRERKKKTLGTRLRRNSTLMTQHYPAPGSADWFKIYSRIAEGYKKRETAVITIASEYSRLSSLSVAVHGCFIHYHCFYNC